MPATRLFQLAGSWSCADKKKALSRWFSQGKPEVRRAIRIESLRAGAGGEFLSRRPQTSDRR
jgi:hypothetical protein